MVTPRAGTRRHRPHAAVAALVAMGMTLGGCPRELAAPAAAGDPCASMADCNPEGLACGELKLCVGGRCEEGRSLRVPCR